jgi:hypothetical protein
MPAITMTTSIPPPVVYRELKPGRKISDTLSIISNELSSDMAGISLGMTEMNLSEHSPVEPPSINRKLKPQLNKSSLESIVYIKMFVILFTN